MSTRGRYGLRAMLELARAFGRESVLMSTVAERQDLSRKHLHALLTMLKSAGLVRSTVGPGGGFALTRHPAQIRLSEVLHALEGPLSIVPCVADDRACDKTDRCATRCVWQELSGAIENVLRGLTLEDLVVTGMELSSPASGRRSGLTRLGKRMSDEPAAIRWSGRRSR